jgi:alanyl aminopeptidase
MPLAGRRVILPPVAVTAAALLVVSIAAPAAAGKSGERLGTDVVPTAQEIRLALDPDSLGYEGLVRIRLDVRRPTNLIRLHGEGVTVASARLEGVRAETLEVEPEADDVIRFVAPRPLSAEEDPSLVVEFTARFGKRTVGLYRVVQAGETYLYTQFEPDDARQAFPCFDEPAFKIPFDVTLTVPDRHVAVSNTAVEWEKSEGGRRTTKYRTTPPLPTYLLAIAVGPLEFVPVPGTSVPTRVVTPRGQSHLAGLAVETTPPILAALERWFDSPLPFEKLDLIAVPEFWPGAMENAGAITYRDRILLVDPAEASDVDRRRLVGVTAHEIAHHWFGNLVTMEWWDDLWLNEAFADWMAAKTTERLYPELRHEMLELESAQRRIAGDARPSTRPIRHAVNTENLMDGVGLAYAKGRTVLGMFEGWLGEETFRRGVLDYLAANRWANARASDLWEALDRASGSDVSGAMAGFLDEPGLPLVRAELEGGGRVRLSQRRFRNHGVEMPEIEWRVPIVLRWEDDTGAHSRAVLLDAPSREIDLDASGEVAWLHPNGGGRGYYRWSVPPERLQDLAVRASAVLGPVERAELLFDAGALLDAGELDGGTYLALLTRFRDDPDPLVLRALASAAGRVQRVFVTTELEDEFAAWTRATFGPALARLGREPAASEEPGVSMTRPQLIDALADWGEDQELRDWASAAATQYLADPAGLHPSLVSTVLETAALSGDADLFAAFRSRFEAASTPSERDRFLDAIASFRSPSLQDEALEWALRAVRPTEMSAFSSALSETEVGRQKYWEFTRDHFETLAGRVSPEFVANFGSVGEGCSPERLAAVETFFKDPVRAVPGTDLTLARVRDSVTDCVGLRSREGEAAARYLRRFADLAREEP